MERERGYKNCSFLGSGRELLFRYRWSGSHVSWCCVEVVLNHHLLHPLKAIRHATIIAFEKIKVGMDTFSTLFSQKTKPHTPFLDPWDHMFLQHMELGSHSGGGELRPIVHPEGLDVLSCGR